MDIIELSTWSPEDKQRIVEEAIRPGASVAEIARRHGLNANLVFAWRRMLQPTTAKAADASVVRAVRMFGCSTFHR